MFKRDDFAQGAKSSLLRSQVRSASRVNKKWDNHRAALALYLAHYNFCRQHKTLQGSTPAMAAGIVKHLWSIEDLLNAATKF